MLIGLSPACAAQQSGSTPTSKPASDATSINSSGQQMQGLWVWRRKWIDTDQAQDQLLDFSEKYGFNRLFVQIHDDPDANEYKIMYPKELARLIAEAGKRGIKVEALDGRHDMAHAEHQEQTLAMLDALIDLNQSLPKGQRFVGVHYDIEPYVGDDWKAGQQRRDEIMTDLLTFYVKARKRLEDRGSDMTLASDIPMWYDDKTDPDDHCFVTFNGQRKNLHQHIQDLCDFVGIMSYRTHATGPNSVSDRIANELAYAEKIGKQVCASLETVELKDTPQITFFNRQASEFWEVFKQVNEHHQGRPGYGGIYVHCYYSLRDLTGE